MRDSKNVSTARAEYHQNNLSHLFVSIYNHPVASQLLQQILLKTDPLMIVLEGSGYRSNIDVLDTIISPRHQPQDMVSIVDINPSVVSEYQTYCVHTFPDKKYTVLLGDINKLPLPSHSVDLVIHNFTVNYNKFMRDDSKTIEEISRVLKLTTSACFFSVGVLYGLRVPYRTHRGAEMHWLETQYAREFRTQHLHSILFESANKTQTTLKTEYDYRRFILIPYGSIHDTRTA